MYMEQENYTVKQIATNVYYLTMHSDKMYKNILSLTFFKTTVDSLQGTSFT